ncbi:MAG: hypothetical protein CO065_11615 [Comamonadaceae bacterium CG_4_9_14_0_8_um_filter_57_21]|nr:MAG: hypothetical protein CO065_11615 [Comamonadaceae bacterium CG_4_9_14_0_8_um_filter_57_21]
MIHRLPFSQLQAIFKRQDFGLRWIFGFQGLLHDPATSLFINVGGGSDKKNAVAITAKAWDGDVQSFRHS